MKKIFYILIVIIISAEVAFAACTLTGGACPISAFGITQAKTNFLPSQFSIEKNKIKQLIPLSIERSILNTTVCKSSDCLNISTKKDEK